MLTGIDNKCIDRSIPCDISGATGPTGPAGATGADGASAYQIWLDLGNTGTEQDFLDSLVGTSADIDLESDSIYDNMSIIEYDNAGVKTYKIGYDPYSPPIVSVNLDRSLFPNVNSYIQELGESLSVPFNTILTKGKNDVTAASILSPVALDAGFQTQLNLTNINAGTSQTIQEIDTVVVATRTYMSNITDGTTTPVGNVTLTFVVPFLYGDSTSLLTQATFKPNLTKSISTQGNKAVTLNGVSSYFYFMYPASYPDLTSILDGNGFEAISAFTKTTENVDMLSGVESMKIYKTAITDIPNQLYTFKF